MQGGQHYAAQSEGYPATLTRTSSAAGLSAGGYPKGTGKLPMMSALSSRIRRICTINPTKP